MKNAVRESDNLEFTVKPSQWVNIFWFMVTVVSAFYIYEWAVIPGVIWLWKWLVINCWEFQFHERTLAERKGVFSVSTREIHYYRIKSVRIEEPFFYRLVGLCSIDILTSDPMIPVLRLYAIGDMEQIHSYVKEMTSYWRKVQGVKEYDLR
jgi:uncharacterized membrane protein YdbT with pleckstrin-like domain